MKSVVVDHDEHSLSYGKYIFGFVASVVLTLMAYVLVEQSVNNKAVVVAVISALAMVQFIIQLVYFLHLGDERKPRWKRLVMWFMIGIVFIIVAGSIWVMNNLNYRMMPEEMEHYVKTQDSL